MSTSPIRLTWRTREAPPEIRGAALTTEREGDPRATLIEGDNLVALAALADTRGGQASLVYLDPPFFTGRQHRQVTRRREASGVFSREEQPAFDDRWENLHAYLTALEARLHYARALLAPHGSLVLHVDPKTSHYAKVLLDELFGPECFASEIVWRYRRWPSKTPNFQRVHDVLLRYVRDPDVEPRFCQLYEPLAASTRATWGTRKQRAVVQDGRRQRSSVGEAESPGAPLGDVWEIGIVAPVARERTGYPTQKPEALLTRLISALTHPGDWVVDPYAGSGTTLAVAAALGRSAHGIDQNPEALRLCEARLSARGVSPSLVRLSTAQERAPLSKAASSSASVATAQPARKLAS